MASIYTKPVQSQFVPTYQPINLDAVNIGAQAMQKRQEENFQRYDQFQSTAREMEKKLFDEDRQLFNRKMKGVRDELEQLAADGDLSDAGRQIRSLANQFKDQATTGKLGTAFKNFEKVQQKFDMLDKAVESGDLGATQAERRKNAIIADYKGVEGDGQLNLGINTDDIDVNQFIKDTVGQMSPSEISRETGWTWKPKIGKFQKGNITVSQIPKAAMRAVIEQSIAADPTAQSALRQRALTQVAGQDEFAVTEDGEKKIISRDQMVDRIIEQEKNRMVSLAQNQFGDIDYDISTELTSPGDAATSQAIADGYTTYVTGVSRVKEMGITDLSSGYQNIRDLEVNGNEQAAEDYRHTMDLAMMNFQGDTEGIEEDDVEFMKQMGETMRESGEDIINTKYPSSVGASVRTPVREGNIESVKSQVGEEKWNRYQKLKGKFNNWLEKSGGYVQDEVSFNNQSRAGNQAFQRADEVIQRSNPGNWRLYGMGEADSEETINKNLENFQFKSVVPGNDYNPTMINGYWENEDGERERVSLVYQRSPGASPSAYDPVDNILNALGSKGQEILKDRRYEHIKVGTDYSNVKDQLPIRSKNEFVGVKRTPEGYQSMYGDENERRPFTEGALINSIMTYANELEGTPREMLNHIDKHGILTDEEKGFILDGSLQNPTGDERDMAQDIRRKLATQFTDPYTFQNKRVATEVAAQTNL